MGLIEEMMAQYEQQQRSKANEPVNVRSKYQLQNVIDSLLSALNPLDWMGGPAAGAQAILGPIRTAAQKKIVKTLAMDAPELLKEAVASKRMLQVAAPLPLEKAATGSSTSKKLMQEVLKSMPQYENYGLYQEAFNPSFGGTMTVNPTTLRGLSPTGKRTSTTLPDVAIHELTHFLSAPQTRALTAPQGVDVSAALQQLLKPHGRETVGEYLLSGEAERAASEALSYLSEVPEARELFMKLRPNLPTPEAGAKGTFQGISGMGVENKPLHQTLVDLGLIKPAENNLWQQLTERLRAITE